MFARVLPQTYAEIVEILKNLPKIKGVRLKIKAGFWGEEYAAESEKATYIGVVDRWANAADKTKLYVMWEG